MDRRKWFQGKYPPSLTEAMALHIFLEELGYSIFEDVYIVFGKEVWVELRDPAAVTGLGTGSPELPRPEMEKLWQQLSYEWDFTFTEEEKQRLMDGSHVPAHRNEICAQLTLNGFPPKSPPLMH